MADDLKQIMDYPDVSFIEWYTQEKLLDDMTTWYMDKYEEENGKRPILAKGDERRLELQACAYYIFHGYELTDLAGKMNLLKYSRADSPSAPSPDAASSSAVRAFCTLEFTPS